MVTSFRIRLPLEGKLSAKLADEVYLRKQGSPIKHLISRGLRHAAPSPQGEGNKKTSATNFFVTEAVKKRIIAVPLRFIAHRVRQPFAGNGGIPQNDTCRAHKKRRSRFVLIGCISPCSNKRTLSFCPHLWCSRGLRLLLPVIAFIILNLIYHNKKRNARVFYLSCPSLL